jgi:hypothetical protein
VASGSDAPATTGPSTRRNPAAAQRPPAPRPRQVPSPSAPSCTPGCRCAGARHARRERHLSRGAGLGAAAGGGGKRSILCGQALLFLAPSSSPVGVHGVEAGTGGGRYFVYRPGGRYFIYRPPLGCLEAVRSTTFGRDLKQARPPD